VQVAVSRARLHVMCLWMKKIGLTDGMTALSLSLPLSLSPLSGEIRRPRIGDSGSDGGGEGCNRGRGTRRTHQMWRLVPGWSEKGARRWKTEAARVWARESGVLCGKEKGERRSSDFIGESPYAYESERRPDSVALASEMETARRRIRPYVGPRQRQPRQRAWRPMHLARGMWAGDPERFFFILFSICVIYTIIHGFI
jgi:hypothetical protein